MTVWCFRKKQTISVCVDVNFAKRFRLGERGDDIDLLIISKLIIVLNGEQIRAFGESNVT